MGDEIVQEWKDNKNTSRDAILSRIHVGHILLIFGVVLFLIYLNSDSLSNNRTFNMVMYAGLIIVILFLIFKPDKGKKIIPEHIAKQIAQRALDKKKAEGKEIDHNSTVSVMGACRLVYENDMTTGTSGPVAWHIGFKENVKGSAFVREGVISIHPYEGFVTGIDWRPLGYSGLESRDKDIIPVGIIPGNVKTTDFGSPGKVS